VVKENTSCRYLTVSGFRTKRKKNKKKKKRKFKTVLVTLRGFQKIYMAIKMAGGVLTKISWSSFNSTEGRGWVGEVKSLKYYSSANVLLQVFAFLCLRMKEVWFKKKKK